jgi:hypothetical protein
MSSLTNCLAGWHFSTHNPNCRGSRFASSQPHCASTDGDRAYQQRSIQPVRIGALFGSGADTSPSCGSMRFFGIRLSPDLPPKLAISGS